MKLYDEKTVYVDGYNCGKEGKPCLAPPGVNRERLKDLFYEGYQDGKNAKPCLPPKGDS